MTGRQSGLLEAAREKHGDIYPVRDQSWERCFTEDNGKLMIWFDFGPMLGRYRSTGCLSERINHGRAERRQRCDVQE